MKLVAEDDYLELVKYLIENGANIHAQNDFALRLAAREGHLEVVKYLIEKGANKNVLSKKFLNKYKL